jgi:hypothetical protein
MPCISLLKLLETLRDELVKHHHSLLQSHNVRTLSLRIDSAALPNLPQLTISFIYKPVPPSGVHTCKLLGRGKRHGVGGWHWGHKGSETKFEIHSFGLPPLATLDTLIERVPSPLELFRLLMYHTSPCVRNPTGKVMGVVLPGQAVVMFCTRSMPHCLNSDWESGMRLKKNR